MENKNEEMESKEKLFESIEEDAEQDLFAEIEAAEPEEDDANVSVDTDEAEEKNEETETPTQ